jgi:hypothetical protein
MVSRSSHIGCATTCNGAIRPSRSARREVLEVYVTAEKLRQIPQGERPVVVLSYDEKPGIQAIAVTAHDLPPRPGRHVTVQRDHEYKRLGTSTLSAAVEVSIHRWRHVPCGA